MAIRLIGSLKVGVRAHHGIIGINASNPGAGPFTDRIELSQLTGTGSTNSVLGVGSTSTFLGVDGANAGVWGEVLSGLKYKGSGAYGNSVARNPPALGPFKAAGADAVSGNANTASKARRAQDTALAGTTTRSLTTASVAPDIVVTRTLPIALIQEVGGVANASLDLFTAATRPAFVAGLKRAADKLGQIKVDISPGEPELVLVGSVYWSGANYTIGLDGPKNADDEVEIFLSLDTVSRVVTPAVEVNGSTDDRLADASAAVSAFNRALALAIATKAEGGTPTWPSDVRPAATVSPPLDPQFKDLYNPWWENVSKALAQAKAATGPTADDAFTRYASSGGTKTRTEWEADAATRRGTAADTAANAGKSATDWTTSLGSALGWTGDKLTSGLAWLGNSALDLLKSWGPTGTVGAYAGVKAVNSVGGDNTKVLMYGALAVGALFLLK